jgi:hypothetical protein
MSKKPENRDEMIKRLTERFRKLLEEKTPEEPGTLGEIEKITQEIGEEIKRDIEESFCDEHGTGYTGPRVACGCGGTAEFKNYYEKRYVSLCCEQVITRAYYYCKSCGSGFAPLDAKLGLDNLCSSIGVRTKVARLAAWIPFERLSKELDVVCGLHLSKNTCERVAESVGKHIKSERSDEEVAVLSGIEPSPKLSPDRLYIGIDGTGVPMRGGGTRESKTGIIYETKQVAGKTKVVRAEYLATLERVDSFGDQVYARAFRRGVENAQDVACLGDGASWIWRSFSHHHPAAVQILDYYHASEHLGTVAKAWYGEGTEAAKRWVKARQSDLLSDCVDCVIRSMRSWIPADDDAREIRRLNLKYFTDNKNRMRYASLAANSYHIGSGLVESACKTVVAMRLKQSGMRWSQDGAEAMLNLRSLLLTNPDVDLAHYAGPYRQ